MADKEKPTIQKHERSITAMEEKLSVVEGLQATTQEQMGQIKMDVAALKKGSFEVKQHLDELTELLKKEIIGKNQTQTTKPVDGFSMVSIQPLTPTHIATIESPVNSGGLSNSLSIKEGDYRQEPDPNNKTCRWLLDDIPKFDGKDPRGWLNKCEKFFQLNPTTDLRARVLCAALHVENDADIWYITVERERVNLLWPEFCNLVCQRFSKVGYENVVGQFNKLTQKGKVEDYITQFDELRNYVMAEEGFHRESYYIDNFISGLKDDIAQYLYNQRPQTMQEARDMARGQEFFLSVLDKCYKTVGAQNKGSYQRPFATGGFSSNSGVTLSPSEGFKKLSITELTEKRQKGLYYHCDKKYEPEHDCRKKMYVMIGDEEVEAVQNDEELAIVWENYVAEKSQGEEDVAAKVSLHAINGSQGNGTIKLQGNIQGHQLEHVWRKILDKYASYSAWWYDIVLGVQWMTTVSPVTFDYSAGTITVNHQGRKVYLQQVKNPTKVQLKLNRVNNKFHREEAYFLIQVSAIEGHHKITEKLHDNIAEVVQEYADIFATPSQLSPPRNQDHYIPLKPGSEPVNSHPYRCPIAHREEIEKLTKEMLEAGVIKASTSPFSSPVLLVRKKRQHVAIEELLAELKGGKVYSKLDLRSGYHQIKVNEKDTYRTTFKTHQGHFKFLVMPYGLTNAPASFQALMNEVFEEYLRKFVLVFFDDILVYNSNLEEHKHHLKLVFDKLRANSLFVKWSKCEIAKEEVEYLGHVISSKGVAADQKKIKAMITWPQPKNIKGLRGFLGLTGYYRRFVKDYGVISRPLTQLLKKGSFNWNDDSTTTFQILKEAMSKTPVLALPNFT
ncbi:uncharacterized protein LOC141665091 [Apium graveolens]|uniref:uncharacterized protein LOC141665091 n=1 Tax=Apium graveolens TaxID=4045 RepID=UPI003D78CF5F